MSITDEEKRIMSISKTIPVVVDLPAIEPKLGFEKYVGALAAAIMGGQPARYTLGLYGPWGTGKSSILGALEKELGQYDESPLVVRFEAWRHERVNDPTIPLLLTIKNAIESMESKSSKKLSKEKLKLAMQALDHLVRAFEISVNETGVPSLRYSGYSGNVADSQPADTETYMNGYEQLSVLGENLPGRTVVLVDDLDRCSPDKVVDILEVIRLLMDVDGFIFVLAIDYEVLRNAIKNKYEHTDPDKFIEKIVQVPFSIPKIAIDQDQLLDSLVPNWDQIKDSWFKNIKVVDLQELFKTALRSNPRQIKRLLNSFLVARHIMGDEKQSGNTLLVASIAMQLRWPEEFQYFERQITAESSSVSGLYVEDTDAFREIMALTDAQDQKFKLGVGDKAQMSQIQNNEELVVFTRRFFGSSIRADELLAVMQFASTFVHTPNSGNFDEHILVSEEAGKIIVQEMINSLDGTISNHAQLNSLTENRWLDVEGNLFLEIVKVSNRLKNLKIQSGPTYSKFFEANGIKSPHYLTQVNFEDFLRNIVKITSVEF